MRLLGTIYEWIDYNPDAYLTNRKFLQKGVSIYNFKKLDKPEKFNYTCKGNSISLQYVDLNDYHSTPLIHFGPQAPYMVTGTFEYMCGVINWASASGGVYPLSKEMLEDCNWEEYDIDQYEKGL